ncbi:hypothetical protein GCM10028857_03120 [Salinarchaeum chitinilyticum]
MSSGRSTVRPVTLARLVEASFLTEDHRPTDEDIATELDTTHRRTREIILEAVRLGLLEITDEGPDRYRLTTDGSEFLESVVAEDWNTTDRILQDQSPHYGAFIDRVESDGPISTSDLLGQLETSTPSQYDFNETSIDLLCDWGQRLGAIQRNVFTGLLYTPTNRSLPKEFPTALVASVKSLEETAGVNLQQRYVSIPELREAFCETYELPRDVFDEGLVDLAAQNVGRIELSGAPIDTGAKDARFGIKELGFTDEDGLVSTEHTSEQVMRGVELHDKQYYYLAIHDENLQYTDQ